MTHNNQLSCMLLGTSLQFSSQLIRVLSYEFPEVRFDRQHDTASLPQHAPQLRLVVIHESMANLEKAVREVRAKLPGAMVAVACADVSKFRSALSPETARSVSLLPLNTPIDVWLSVLRLLLCGHTYVPAEVYCGLREGASRRSETPNEVAAVAKACLTPREMQILPLIAQGKQNKVIAGALGLSEHTVKLHTHNIFAKLGVSNRTAAANWYLSQIEGEDSTEQTHED